MDSGMDRNLPDAQEIHFQKCQGLWLLKLPQKLWFGTRRPLSLLISYVSYPNLCFPPCLQENSKCFPMQHLLLLKAIRK